MTYTTEFHSWWIVYPRRVAKKRAAKAFEIAVAEIALEKGIARSAAIRWLIERTEAFSRSDKGNSGRFCPHPATWLNDGRYDDDPLAWCDSDSAPIRPKRIDPKLEAERLAFRRMKEAQRAKHGKDETETV